MKPFTYYGMSDGTQPQYPQIVLKPILKRDSTPAEARAYADALELHEVEKEKYKAALDIYHKEQNKRTTEFQNDLFEEFGVTNNPKADKCYQIAYSHGHSSGFQEVYNYFSEFVELILP